MKPFYLIKNLKNIKTFDQNKLKFLIKKIKENVQIENNMFNSFSKDFKLNFSPLELKNYKKFKRVIIIGLGGSILGAQAVNLFLKKKIKKEFIFINDLNLIQIDKLKKIKILKFVIYSNI